MRILITGGCGFIGTNISLEAIKRGYKVIAMDSLIRRGSEENLKFLKGVGVDILRGDVRNIVDFQRSPVPDAIIHLAGNPGIPWSIDYPMYDFEVNARGTINVLEYARQMSRPKPIPVIYASTNKVYSDKINDITLTEQKNRYSWDNEYENGIPEDYPIDSLSEYHHSPYGVSKMTGDQYCQEYFHIYNLPTVVNRMSCIYGLHQKGVADQGWIDHFVRKIGFGDGKLDFYGNGKQVRDMLWGGDVARLYLDELEQIDKVKGQVFNVGGGVENTLSLNESIKVIEKLTDNKAQIEYHDWRPADQRVYISDISKVKETLNWKPQVTPKQGIKMMIDYYEESGI